MQATAALAEYRRGDNMAAIKRLATRVTPLPEFSNTQALAEAIRALACQSAGRTADARAALTLAKSIVARERPRPDQGSVFDWDWHNWIQVEILVREAESLHPGGSGHRVAPRHPPPRRRTRGVTGRRGPIVCPPTSRWP